MTESQTHTEQKPPIFAELKKLGAELRQIRRDIPMTQEAMAAWLGMGEKKVAQIEAGLCTDLQDVITYAGKVSVSLNLSYTVF